MSASGMSTRERGDASGTAGVFAGAFWLAKREVRRAWISYPLTGLLLTFVGFIVVPSVSGMFEFDGLGSVVGSRALRMLLALVVNVPAVFLPAFLLSDLGGLGMSYLWFCGVWVGYGLLAAGLLLLLELTVEDKTRALISIGSAAAIGLVLALLEWTVDLRLVGRTVGLAQAHGALPAVLSILAGSATFVLLAWLTAERLEKRDIPESVSG